MNMSNQLVSQQTPSYDKLYDFKLFIITNNKNTKNKPKANQ